MNQLQKYTWLIDTIRRAGKISHKDLSDRWSRNKDFSDGRELHRATFNRWRDAIYEQFGIMIDCRRLAGIYTISPIRRILTRISSKSGCLIHLPLATSSEKTSL